MARVDERLYKVLKEIGKVHNPISKDGEYDISLSKKINSICSYLENIGFDCIINERYGILVSTRLKKPDEKIKKSIKNKIKKTKYLITSHIDLIKKFNDEEVLAFLTKQFKDIDGFKDYDQEIKSALDNTLTNAVLISLLEMRKTNFSDDLSDILVLFSIGEELKSERGFKEPKGVKNFIKDFKKELSTQNLKCFNLDVTASEYHDFRNDQEVFAFIEYDKTMNKKSVTDYFNRFNFKDIEYCDYGYEGTYDDLTSITKVNLWGVSICINTYGTIHSKKNFTYVKHIDRYFNLLNEIISNR